MELHLVDATYELFRAFYSPRPAPRGTGGRNVGAVAGLVLTLLALLRDEGATHVGCATDQVIRSFRNDLYPGYKTEAGMPIELLAQFPVAEDAMRALGLTVWPMVEFEADDALATAASRWADHPNVERVLICTPDKDLAQCVRGGHVVLRDRRRGLTLDDSAVHAKWGVPPAAMADYLALVGDSADNFPGLPGWGARSAAALLDRYGSLELIPDRASAWDVSVRSAPALAATLRERRSDALLFRELARLRTDVPLPERDPEELRWRGAPRLAYQTFCDEVGLATLRDRPHRWKDDVPVA